MTKNSKYKIEKTFVVYRLSNTGKCVESRFYNSLSVIELLEESTHESEDDAIEHISNMTDTYTPYTILPVYRRVTDFD